MQRSATQIQTNRLWLRQIDETDAESIVKVRSDEGVYRYFINPKKLTVEDHLEWYRNNYVKSANRIDWIAVDDENGAFIGVYGIKIMDSKEIEISYITSPEKLHKGYASEAVRAIIKWCKSHFDVNCFFVSIHEDNMDSIGFAHAIGFKENKKEGKFLKMVLGDMNV